MAGMTGLPKNPKREDIVSWVQREAKVPKATADKIVTNASTWSSFKDPSLLAEYLHSRIAVYQKEQQKATQATAAQQQKSADSLATAKKAAGLLHAMGLYDGPMDASHLTSGDFRKSGDFIQALHAYQQQRNLPSSGSLDAATLKDINASLSFIAKPQGAPDAPPAGPAPARTTGTPATAPAAPAQTGWQFGEVHALTPAQLAQAAQQAGFSGPALTQAVAVALAESNGVSEKSKYPGEQSFGVTQINVPSHPEYDPQKLLDDPVYAFKAMYNISNGGQDFSQWTTVSGNKAIGLAPGEYLKHMQVAAAATGTTASAGGGPALGASDTLPPNATDAQIQAYVEKNYPQAAPFLADPEIRKILIDAAHVNADDTEIEAKVRQTNYWQTHGAPSRAFDALIGSDGVTAGQVVDKAKQNLGDALAQNGIHPTDAQLGEAAKKAIRAGWISLSGSITDTNAVQDFSAFLLNQQRNPDGSLPAGQPSAVADQLRTIANSYMVPMTEKDLADRALDITTGKMTADGFTAEMAQHAKSLFQNAPDVQKAIDAGRTPDQYFAPMKNLIAQTLELAPDQVDLLSPRYQSVIQKFDPAIKGNRPMTLGEAGQWARDQDAYRGTAAYRDTRASTLNQMKAFIEGRAA